MLIPANYYYYYNMYMHGIIIYYYIHLVLSISYYCNLLMLNHGGMFYIQAFILCFNVFLFSYTVFILIEAWCASEGISPSETVHISGANNYCE